MSGVAGLWHLDGRPAAPADAERMVARLAHRGPDGSGIWTGGAVALGHRLLHTTPESLGERQPLASRDGRLVLTADAHLDNREELRAALGPHAPPVGASDAALILSAYESWGEECLGRLLGDFAFAVWDARRQVLFCARDPLGVRPFYYHSSPHRFVFASEIKALFTQPEVPRRPNGLKIADYLVPCLDDRAATYFADVVSLPGGHCLTVGRPPAAPRAYWSLDLARDVALGGDAACAQAFREVFGEAVRSRLRSAVPLGATLSGGLDSSSVVGTARRLAGADARPRPVLSAIFPDIPACDERGYIDSVVARGGLVPLTMRGDHLDPLGDAEAMPWDPDDTMHSPGLHLHWALYRAAREAGLRVLLIGTAGDTVVSHGGARVHELMRVGRWLTGAREALGVARNHGLPLGGVARAVASPLVPRALRRAWRRIRHPKWLPGTPAISADLARLVGLTDRQREFDRWRANLVRDARTDHWRRLVSPGLATIVESLAAGAGAVSIEIRDPFLDRRVVELCLSLPSSQKLQDGQTRVVQRRAMADVLPPDVRNRPGKAHFGPLVGAALTTFGRPRLDALMTRESVLAPYVDLPSLRATYRRYVAHGDRQDAYAVWKAAALALWLERTKLTPT